MFGSKKKPKGGQEESRSRTGGDGSYQELGGGYTRARYYNEEDNGEEPQERRRSSQDPARTSARYYDGGSAGEPYRGQYKSSYEGRRTEGAHHSGAAQDKRGEKHMEQTQGRKRRKKHTALKVILILLLLLIIGGAVLVYLTFGRIDRQTLHEIVVNTGLTDQSGYRNIALYGVDSRTGELTKECHSDTIIICSINQKTKEIRLASVYRDTYLDNTNGEYRKATECYYFGGPERSISMLNKNLDLDIEDYVTVNFNSVVKALDLLGGIDLEITEEEMDYINGYCVENKEVTGVDYTPLTEYGYVHLDGIQALAYCRIRYTDGWDYKRTERQRTVITLAYQKAMEQGVSTLLSIANTMLPEISTSMSNVEILSLVSSASSYSFGSQTGFPFEKTTMTLSDAGDCVIPVNLARNVSELHEFLYDVTDYVPSDTVQEISNTIMNVTGVTG